MPRLGRVLSDGRHRAGNAVGPRRAPGNGRGSAGTATFSCAPVLPGSVRVLSRFCPGSAPRGSRGAPGAAASVVFIPGGLANEFCRQRIPAGAAGPARSRSPGGAAGSTGGCGSPESHEAGQDFGEGSRRRRFGSRGFERRPRCESPVGGAVPGVPPRSRYRGEGAGRGAAAAGAALDPQPLRTAAAAAAAPKRPHRTPKPPRRRRRRRPKTTGAPTCAGGRVLPRPRPLNRDHTHS